MRTNIVGIAVAACLIASNTARAQDTEQMFSLSGFGTLGLLHSSTDQADFGASVFAPKGAGYTDKWSANVDSRLGVQLTANFTPQLTGTLQVVAEQRHNGNYTPHVEWANIKYQLTPQLSVRIGRTALASFLGSDFRKVGYANPWIRPPEEVYGLVPIYSGDGIDASYRLNMGRVNHTLLVGFGRTDTKTAAETYKSRDQWTLSDTVEYGDWTARIAWQTARVRIGTLDAMMAGFRQFGPQGTAIADHYDPNGHVDFVAVGGTYDPGAWFVTSEWGRANLRSAFGKRSSWYTTAGYRIGDFTPYVSYASTDPHSNRSDPGISLTGLPPQSAAAAAQLNAGLNMVLGSIPAQNTITAGGRWDFHKNMVMTVQYDRINLGAGSAGVFTNVQPGFRPGGTVHLLGVSLDFVW